ncbi:MAG: glutamine synthetase type III, partial [Clostridiales bacterium]|nr:glutamine synthetase type III [Clostridiales bacterium]
NIVEVVEDADVSVQKELVKKLNDLYIEASKALATLDASVKKAQKIEEIQEKARAYKFEVCEAMQALRILCDALEETVAEEYWPFPTYCDLLFRV